MPCLKCCKNGMPSIFSTSLQIQLLQNQISFNKRFKNSSLFNFSLTINGVNYAKPITIMKNRKVEIAFILQK
jgi:hypothetical protein